MKSHLHLRRLISVTVSSAVQHVVAGRARLSFRLNESIYASLTFATCLLQHRVINHKHVTCVCVCCVCDAWVCHTVCVGTAADCSTDGAPITAHYRKWLIENVKLRCQRFAGVWKVQYATLRDRTLTTGK